MTDLAERTQMGRKKSEVRRHTAMVRISEGTLEQAKLASSLMRMTLSDYVDDLVLRNANRDITREAKKLAEGQE